MRTAAATSGPAREPRPASSAPATKRASSPRSNLKSLAAWRWRRRRADAFRVRFLEGSDSAGRPVGEEGLADDPISGDRAPEAAVVASSTVVAHHEVVIGWNGDLFRQIARRT